MRQKTILIAGFVLLLVGVLAWLRFQSRAPAQRGAGDASGSRDERRAEPELVAPQLDEETRPLEATREAVAPSDDPAAGARADELTLRILVVREDDNGPIPGARVTAFEEPEPPPAGVTDEDGRCELRIRSSASTTGVGLMVEREGFFHVRNTYERLEEVTVRLAPAVTVFGRALAADTLAPIPGARIQRVHPLVCNGCAPDVVTTGEDGRYELASVPRNRGTTFELDADGFAHQERTFELRAEEPRVELDFQLERGFEIAGRVVDFESGAGLAWAKVGELMADSAGAFRGRVLPDRARSTASIRVEMVGHCTLSCALGLGPDAEGLRFALPRGAIIEGVVKDEDGQPIARAGVFLGEDHGARFRAGAPPEPSPFELPDGWKLEPPGVALISISDAQGRFRIEGAVPWSTFYTLSSSEPGYAEARTALARLGGPGETTQVELVLRRVQPEAKVHGSVRLNGEPLSTAQGRVHWKGAQRSGEGVIDGGDFYLEVEPGEVVFRLEIEGLPSAEGTETILRLEPGVTIEHAFELRVAARPIRGRVTFRDGGAAAGASVDASFPIGDGDGYWDRLHLSTEAAADGTYELEVPDVMQLYRVAVELDHDERELDGVRAGASAVDFVLTRGGALHFRMHAVDDEAALNPSQFDLEWKPVADPDFRSVYLGMRAPDPDGWYELRLPAGRIDFKVSERWGREGYLPALFEDLRIQPHTPCEVEVVLTLGRMVELVLAPDQEWVPKDHRVYLLEAERCGDVQWLAEQRVIQGGRMGSTVRQRFVHFGDTRKTTIRGLEPGRFRFKVFPDDVVIEPAEIVVGAEPMEPVVVRWRSTR